MALVKDDNHMIIKRLVALIALNKRVEFLDGRNDNFSVWVAQLPRQNPRASITIRCALLKLVVLFHRLVVEVFAINHEKHLINIIQLTRQLSRLKTRQRLTATCGMPNITASLNRTELFVICSNLDAIQNTLGRHDLVRAHYQQ